MNKRNHAQYLNTMVNDTISRHEELFSHLELNLQSWAIITFHDYLFTKTNDNLHDKLIKNLSREILIPNPKRYGSYDQCNASCKICRSGHLYRGCDFCNKQACAGFNDLNGQTSCCGCFKNSPKYKREDET